MSLFRQDVRYGLRTFLRAPGFTIVSVLMFAFGIGAITAMFVVVDAVLLSAPTYPDAEKLMRFCSAYKKDQWKHLSFPDFEDIRTQLRSFKGLAGWEYTEVNLTRVDAPLRVRAARVMPEFFHVVGVEPVLGRRPQTDGDQPSNNKVVILSDGTWRRVFGADAGIVGNKIDVDDEAYSVYGVMPAGFDYPGNVDIWIPWNVRKEWWAHRRDTNLLKVIARVSSEVTAEEAQTELDLLWRRLRVQYPEVGDMTGVELVPEYVKNVEKVRIPLLVLMLAVAFLFLVVCINLAGLFLSRGVHRQKEIAIRSALGAKRARVACQLLTETLLLSIPSCCLGLFLAYGSVRLLLYLYPAGSFLRGVPRLDEANIDLVTVLFVLTATMAATLISGIFPALRYANLNPEHFLKDVSISATPSGFRASVLSALAAGQIALSLMVLLGAGLLLKSYHHLVNVDLGFETENRLTAQTVLSRKRYPNAERKTEYMRESVNRLKGIPSVLSVAATSNIAFSNYTSTVASFEVEGQQIGEDQERRWPIIQRPWASFYSVSNDYFKAMGIKLLKGRSFGPHDTAYSEPVMIIDRRLEALLLPHGDALGKRVIFKKGQRTIVGVTVASREKGPLREPVPTIYVPYNQYPTERLSFVLKTAVPPETVLGQTREELRAIDPFQPIYNVETLGAFFKQSISRNSFYNLIMGFFGLSALTLACIGLYHVLSFQVLQRTQEVGIRRALGACRGDIFKMFVLRGVLLLVVGLVMGNLAAVCTTRFLSSMLFGVGTLDTETFLMVGIVFFSVGLVACILPALRAVRLDPSSAMRYE